MKSYARKRWITLVILIIVAAVSYFQEERTGSSNDPNPTAKADARFPGYTVLKDCTLVDWRSNDGDSFKVQHSDGTDVFRLYFVDTPETNTRFPERVGYQAEYFDTSMKEIVEVGKSAKKFALELLQREPFTLYTQWENVMGGDRFHAFVELSDGEFLSKKLVGQGYARIYTMPSDLPDGTPKEQYDRELKKLEQTAKRNRLGGWQ